MATVDPFLSLRQWRIALFRGNSIIVDLFLKRIDTTLSSEWKRDSDHESTLLRPDRTRCYLFDQAGDAAVRLWLQRVTETRVRGGPVQVLRVSPSGDAERISELVADFADKCVRRAADVAGVRSSRPVFGPRSVVSSDAELLFNRFADTADGQWPLSSGAKESWDELISGCLAAQVAVDRGELIRWLEDSGWEQAAVTLLADKFFSDSDWLARRLAATSP